MRLAFDLDNTLIRCGTNFPLEKPRWAWLAREKLRCGIRPLVAVAQAQGWEVWVDTSSFRGPWYIRWLFWRHGIHLNGVVNQTRHNRRVTVPVSKYPPAFGIDLLVDDSEGVWREGQRYGFRVVVVSPHDNSVGSAGGSGPTECK